MNTNVVDMFSIGATLIGNPRDYNGGGIPCPNGIYCLTSTGLWSSFVAPRPASGLFMPRSD
jgi:hypothetical protein